MSLDLGTSSLMERRKYEQKLLVKDLELQKKNEILKLKLESKQKEGESMEVQLQDQRASTVDKFRATTPGLQQLQSNEADELVSLAESDRGAESNESIHSMSMQADSASTASISAVDKTEAQSSMGRSRSPMQSTPLPIYTIKMPAAFNAGLKEIESTAAIKAVDQAHASKSAHISAGLTKNGKPAKINADTAKKNSTIATDRPAPDIDSAAITSELSGSRKHNSAAISVELSYSDKHSTKNIFDVFHAESGSETESPTESQTITQKQKRRRIRLTSSVDNQVEPTENISSDKIEEVEMIAAPTIPAAVNNTNTQPAAKDGSFEQAINAPRPEPKMAKKTSSAKVVTAQITKKPTKSKVVILDQLASVSVRGRPDYEGVQVLQNLEHADGIEIGCVHCTENEKWPRKKSSFNFQWACQVLPTNHMVPNCGKHRNGIRPNN